MPFDTVVIAKRAVKVMDINQQKLEVALDKPWSIGSGDYMTLKSHVQTKAVSKIVELGSGQSTFQLQKDFPRALLYSLESDPVIRVENDRELAVAHEARARVMFSRVTLSFKRGAAFVTYDFQVLKDVSLIDVLVIDGPVERLYPMGREASLYFLFEKLSIGAVIGLDDYHRLSAKAAVKNWLSVFGKSLELREETDSFAVLVKTGECPCLRFGLPFLVRTHCKLVQGFIHRSRERV